MRLHYSLTLLASAVLLWTGTSASPTPGHHVVHEKRSSPPPAWTKQERADGNMRLPLRIGLKQRNLHHADEFLDSVSNPKSSKYASYWTAEDVADMFAPSDESISSVKLWLLESGIPASRVSVSPSKSWISVVNATVSEAEALLQTEYYTYEHYFGKKHIACESYSIPGHLSAGEHIDLIMPTLHFDAKVVPGRDDLSKRDAQTVQAGAAKNVGKNSGFLPKQGAHLNPQSIISQLEHCDTQIVPNCLRALYTFPPGFTAHPGNSYGIVEYTPQAYVPADLDMFFANFSKKQVGQRPILASIDGGIVQQEAQSFGYNGESDLDIEYAMSLIYPQTVTLYQVGDEVEGASFNNFLDALDASYCAYEGGDDPSQDAAYPDPLPGGYKGAEDCGKFKATNVISTSYGYNEADLTPAYEVRQCHEYMKLGLQGVTVLYSSGDNGVAGNGDQCIGSDGNYNNGTSGRFNPSFPGGCPYVTSVGATQVPTGTNIVLSLATGTQPEVACETVIYSGGGFSNVFEVPSYQAAAVSHYLTTYPPPYTAAQYNNSGKARAFPDVSANGANYVVAIDGGFSLVYGTSASSPTFGSVVTLINEARLNIGKKPVGFLNPALYAHPWVMNDVTQGTNPGCGTPGFNATAGWDPVTGLGTPNYLKMLGLFLALP
ncbi:peptidase S8/S53 domain-containing protein [Diplogelasinospora grovesii]|uniref:tripeptidyl-peptidase II n=1 Tax=Diplogelasinospora grovesii TaxID=303347 RepID=A0AAN6N830_9PEZI|nr:peptidase S8/S53 domain-containing protein [Diplogelasinospora grovesii]